MEREIEHFILKNNETYTSSLFLFLSVSKLHKMQKKKITLRIHICYALDTSLQIH